MGFFDLFKKEKHVYKDENVFNDNGHNKIYEGDGTYQVGNKVDGKQHGLWQIFDADGLLLEEINFKNDLMHGLLRQFNDDGVLTNEFNFNDGESNGILRVYHQNGKVAEEGNLLADTKKDGLWKYYFEDGTLKHEGCFKDAVQDGIWKHYHENGVLQFEGTYQNGEKVGFWESFDSDGNVIDERVIKDGKEYSKNAMPEGYKETPEDKIKELLNTYSNIVSKMEAKEYDAVIKDSTKLIETLEKLSKSNPTEGVHGYGDANGISFSIIDVYYLRGSARMSTSNNDALIDFNKVLDELDPDHIEARYNRSVFYHNFNKDTQSALNDIVVCLDLKPNEKEFIEFHEALENLYLQSLSESEFLILYKCYYETCLYYDFLINDNKEVQQVVNQFFNNIFNKFYKNSKGVDWSKIKNLQNGHEMREFSFEGPPERLVADILSLNIYHKNILTNLIINIIGADKEISKESFNQLLRFLQDAGLPPSSDLDLVSKMKNKIGDNPFEAFDLSNNEEQIVKTIS